MSTPAAGWQPSPAAARPVTSRPGPPAERRQRPAGPVVALDAELRERPSLSDTHTARGIVTRVQDFPPGPFDANAVIDDPSDSLGLVILEGLIAVGLDAGRAQVSWLIGSDDLVRPWDMQESSLTERPDWQALTATRIAVLDGDFRRRVARIPAITQTLVAKAAQTTRWLFAKSLIVSCPIIEEKLLLLFALLAERWGRVTPQGVLLELPLTHDLLARMCGARRPSVTMSLRALSEAGLVRCPRRRRWLLQGGISSQASLRWAGNPCWRRYADAIGFAGGSDDPASRGQAA